MSWRSRSQSRLCLGSSLVNIVTIKVSLNHNRITPSWQKNDWDKFIKLFFFVNDKGGQIRYSFVPGRPFNILMFVGKKHVRGKLRTYSQTLDSASFIYSPQVGSGLTLQHYTGLERPASDMQSRDIFTTFHFLRNLRMGLVG